MQTRRRIVLVSLSLLIAVGALTYSAFGENAVYYLTVDEAVARAAELGDRPFRVSGAINRETITYDIRGPLLRFQVVGEQGGTLWIEYAGVRPDNLDEAPEAVAEGRLVAPGVVSASKLMLTCPSRYESEPAAGAEGGTSQR